MCGGKKITCEDTRGLPSMSERLDSFFSKPLPTEILCYKMKMCK